MWRYSVPAYDYAVTVLASAFLPDLEPRRLACRHADIYDALADEYAARAERLVAVTTDSVGRVLALAPPGGGRALDVGAGAGLVAQALISCGYRTTAIDVAPRMAEVCRARVPEATVVVGDYLDHRFDAGFDVMVAFAFIHLFPTALAVACMTKMRDELADEGLLLIGTTAEVACTEGFEDKADYPGSPRRYRRRWTESAFLRTLNSVGFRILDVARHDDPFGKRWTDVVVRKPLVSSR